MQRSYHQLYPRLSKTLATNYPTLTSRWYVTWQKLKVIVDLDLMIALHLCYCLDSCERSIIVGKRVKVCEPQIVGRNS